ncbi:hypothetical protein BCT30_01215 [Enterovibrio norvegicus]|uniref:Uncharacterized protein n=1 Tax=Enterovibrio norvegicus DSM 15893 TaxID=1121869 RepID=A0A1I5K7C7_9GAMM|nr:hypothetical protein [Enterovibrio norvegicus]MCC4798087.1 hypothetical protein [Enterovibrio norvegicus]OEE63708.1 hypothetical protein A1OS_16840 [Enterovibrio norvegicus]OEF51736.1 hypothetical protein A1OW_23215 [Enterovibrio norvegicus]PMH72091.1 hypothetical protein BCU62_03450 [Enterovibrio norvegicus]PMI32358.1 hypothetical protein BCU47_01735 [Enterovibrio norvegicus]
MTHSLLHTDIAFVASVEECSFPVEDFNHRAHVRLAYAYFVDNDTESSNNLLRKALVGLLQFNDIAPSAKYHETLTKAWLLAVNHFMHHTDTCDNADMFIDLNPQLLDSQIMMTHYTKARLFSEEARHTFIAPDLDAIPEYA